MKFYKNKWIYRGIFIKQEKENLLNFISHSQVKVHCHTHILEYGLSFRYSNQHVHSINPIKNKRDRESGDRGEFSMQWLEAYTPKSYKNDTGPINYFNF